MKLVLVDDEKRIVQSAKTEISLGFTDDQFEIFTFTNPKEALKFITNNRQSIFLVITDMRMPAMNGVFLLREINSLDSDIFL